MIDPVLLAMLVCPSSRQPLRVATAEELAAANAAIAAGTATARGGSKVDEPLVEALATVDGEWLYPIRDGFPILLTTEAIRTARDREARDPEAR